MNKEIYEVSRYEYSDFISTLKPEAREIHSYKAGTTEITELISKKTGAIFAARESHKTQGEKYYIYTLPDADESLPPIPKYRLTLETPEEVQEFLKFINKEKTL